MIHVITGPPCAGKSTFVRENAKDGDLRIDYDLIAQALGAMNSHSADGLVKQAAFNAREGAIQTALKNSEAESWVIHTSPSEDHMKAYEDAGAEVITLDPGYEVCMERAKADGRPQQTIDGIEKYYSGKKGREMEHLYKSFGIKSDESSGTISGYFSTYDRIPDSYGDVIAPGAFTETIEKRKATGHPFPLCWNHDLDQIIGMVDTIEDTEKGPLMTATFFDTPLAQEKRAIVQSGVVYQFSFAYDVLEAGLTTLEDGTKANELRKLDLFEVSIVPIPANRNAVVTDIKSDTTEVKAGRRNRKSDEDIIKQIISLAQSLLDEVNDADDPDDGEDDLKANTAVEEPEESNLRKENLLAYINNVTKEVKS